MGVSKHRERYILRTEYTLVGHLFCLDYNEQPTLLPEISRLPMKERGYRLEVCTKEGQHLYLVKHAESLPRRTTDVELRLDEATWDGRE